MELPLSVGVDIGTQGTKAVLTDTGGHILGEAFEPSVLCRTKDGGVFEEPARIFDSVIRTVAQVTASAGAESKRIRALGIDSQMAGIMGIGTDFEAVTPLDSWLDTRCAEYTALIAREAGDEAVRKSGGQIINAHAPKILWWKKERPEAFREIRKFVMPNAYAAGKLCGLSAGDAFMDYTFLHFNNFSDNLNCGYNDALLDFFGVEKEKMPRIVSPGDVIGTVSPEYARQCGLSGDVRVIAGCGDTAASSLGAGITEPGLAYDVAGTASVFACCTERFSPDLAHKTLLFSRSVLEGLFLPLAYISGGGLCLKWFSDLCGKSLRTLDREAETVDPGSRGVYFLPHLSGRTCPLDDRVSGAFLGLKPDSSAAEMYRAVLESVAFEYKSYLDILCDSGCTAVPTAVRGVGGGAKSSVFAKIKADVLGVPYLPLDSVCSAPAAMALLAACCTGLTAGTPAEVFAPGGAEMRRILPDAAATAFYRPLADRYLQLLNGYAGYFFQDGSR